MLFFRLDADLNDLLGAKNAARGATLTVSQLWQLSQRWYHNLMDKNYHGRSLEQAREIFKKVGLVSKFSDTAGFCGQRLTPDMEVEIIRL
jgi:hypothetical protein